MAYGKKVGLEVVYGSWVGREVAYRKRVGLEVVYGSRFIGG